IYGMIACTGVYELLQRIRGAAKSETAIGKIKGVFSVEHRFSGGISANHPRISIGQQCGLRPSIEVVRQRRTIDFEIAKPPVEADGPNEMRHHCFEKTRLLRG